MVTVTNNPLLEHEEGILFVDGTFRDVLVTVRNMVYEGYELISHPLFASSRMMFSPYRSVLIGKKNEKVSQEECQIVEESLFSYDRLTARRRRQPEHDDDYAVLDLTLHQAALEEHEARLTD